MYQRYLWMNKQVQFNHSEKSSMTWKWTAKSHSGHFRMSPSTLWYFYPLSLSPEISLPPCWLGAIIQYLKCLKLWFVFLHWTCCICSRRLLNNHTPLFFQKKKKKKFQSHSQTIPDFLILTWVLNSVCVCAMSLQSCHSLGPYGL